MQEMKIYFKIVEYQLKAQLEHQVNAILGFFNQFIVICFEFFALWTLLNRFGSVADWSLSQVFMLYGIVNFSFSMAEVTMRGFESNMTSLVRNGEYDRYLLRPQNTILQISAYSFQFVRLGRAIQAILIIIIGIILNYEAFNILDIGLLILTLSGGVVLYFSLYILIGILTFKYLQNVEFMSIFIQGSTQIMQYPKTIFPKWIQNMFTFIFPVAAVTYFPVSTIFEKTQGGEYVLGFFSPFIGFVIFGLSVYLFLKVEKNYISSGN